MGQPPARILLVEDTRVHARIVERCLGDGYDLTVAHSAEQALQQLRGHEFDLLIVDWALPGTNGLRLVRALQQSERFREVPVIMQTAKDRAENVRQAMAAGATDYVVKPINCQTLRSKVDAAL